MKIFNGSPHPINVVGNGVSDPAIRKLVVPADQEPQILVSIPSNGMLSAKIEDSKEPSINGIPVFGKKVTGCDPIPEGYDVIIVSALYVSAARAMGLDTARLYTVANPVYSQGGKSILGCQGICRAF
ncbi:MAG: hypothetical protein Q8L10_03380 [Candidatus Moranbacteria bacterium]|nr:hypothetical protein [Candidatus Moranbacteria bacterium]